jgi:hypothetical protein
MSAKQQSPQGRTAPQNMSERLAFANRLYREFHARCFWHCPRELTITEELIPFVVKGLRAHGGHHGFKLAGRLQSGTIAAAKPDRGLQQCR